MSPQEALDAPRWRYEGQGRKVALEPALANAVGSTLAAWGHELVGEGGFFGGGQAALRHPDHGTFQGASDSRRDGCALGF
jgi:gamma-glutamyltranspeptidase/glutathione hydrolase